MLCHAYFLPESCPLVDELVGAKTEASDIDVSIIWLVLSPFLKARTSGASYTIVLTRWFLEDSFHVVYPKSIIIALGG
jgi:hypothetical protein